MRISIVTISYNQARFLEQAILSVLNQDYPDIEYVVVDPGSTDGSREIIEKYRCRISRVVLEQDAGAADGLNKGFYYCTGDIFCFVNSDDTLLPGTLIEVADYFSKHQDVDVVSGHGLVIDGDDNKLRRAYSDKYSLLRDAYGMSILVQPSTFFRRQIYERSGGFNISNRSNWDGELFYKMAMSGARFTLMNRYWSCYRIHSSSITGSKRQDAGRRVFCEKKFEEILGRKRKSIDRVAANFFRVYKHLSNPRALWERLAKGAIYGRAVE